MKARVGTLLFGIGIFAIVIAAGCAFYVAPSVAVLPYDLRLCEQDETQDCLKASVAEAPGARFLQTKGGEGQPTVIEVQSGTLRSTTEIDPQHDQTDKEMKGTLEGEAVVWNAYGTVTWVETNEMISKYQAGLALDRSTAGARSWENQFLHDAGDKPEDVKPVDFAGQLYKFPFGTEKKSYEYFDRDLRKAFPIEFQATETIEGLETYRFQQVIPETPLDFAPERLSGLLSRFAPGVESGQVTYANTRTIWVEPVSGTFIKVAEQQRKTLVPQTGARTELLNGDFVYTDETVTHNVNSAGDTKSQVRLISNTLPIALAVVGALLLIIGLFLVTSARRAAGRHRQEEIADADDNGKVTA